MNRSRAFRPFGLEVLEDRAVPSSSQFQTDSYLNLSTFHNGLGDVQQGSMISLNQAFHEGFKFGWGSHQHDPGTVVVVAGSHEHPPRVYLMKANSFTVWEYRWSAPFVRIFTSRDVADGSLARTARRNQWPWAALITERAHVIPSKGLPITGSVSGAYTVATGAGSTSLTLGHGVHNPIVANKAAKSNVMGLLAPIGPVHVTGTLPVSSGPNPAPASNGNLTLRTPAGWLKLALTGPTANENTIQPSSFVDQYKISKGTATLEFAKGKGEVAIALAPNTFATPPSTTATTAGIASLSFGPLAMVPPSPAG